MATNFEEITKSPEVLGAFLASLPYLEGPWDTEFQRNFCAGCGQVTCDPICRYQRFRNNPSWWLTLEADPAEQLGTVVIDLDPHGTEAPIATEEAEFNDERLFVLMPDDQEKTMILAPLKSGATSIKLTKQTAEVLVAMLNRQIREWSKV